MYTSRAHRLAVMGAASLLALAACSSSGGSKSGGKPTYTIGFQGPLSGDNAQLGINGVDGVKLAVDQANAKGDLPFVLKLKQSDDMGSPDQSPTAAQTLIDDPNVIAVVGPMFSGATKAAEPAFSQANLLSVTPSATNPKLTSLGFTTFFREIPNDNVQGAGAADYIAKVLKPKKVYSLNDKSDYGLGLAKALEAQLGKDGVSLTTSAVDPRKDYSGVSDGILSSNADLVYYSGYYAEFSLLTKSLRGKGYKGTLMSGDGSNDDQYIVQAGASNAEGSYLTCACGDANSDPALAAFVTAYGENNAGAKPGTYSGEGFDATNAIISVMKTLSGTITRESLASAFKAVDYQGITKQVKFEPNGEIAGNAVFIYEIKSGKRELLGTTDKLIPS